MKLLVKNLAFILTLLAVLASSGCKQEQPQPTRVSAFGVYSGYSEAPYDGYQRSSRYITARDGTKLAVDIFRPTKNGQVAQDSLPVIWTHSRYHRASVKEDGSLMTALDSKWVADVMKHGYVVAAMDTRGGGASFGTQPGFFAREEAHDAYDFTEWLASQSWSTGKIGMFGRSYLGITQYFAAGEVPPHLKAIFPEMSSFEWYDFIYAGGIYRDDFLRQWGRLTKDLDGPKPQALDFMKLAILFPVAKVDEDKDGSMLAAAMRDHEKNRDVFQMFDALHFRDTVDPVSKNKMVFAERSPWTYAAGIEKSGVAVYHLAGWFDMFPRDTIFWFNNIHNPQKVVIGPWFHGGMDGLDYAAEHLRFYDFWLKGIDNGVMREPAFHYWTMGAPKGQEWHATSKWPLPNEKPTQYFFQEQSALDTAATTSAKGQDDFKVDYSATTTTGNRWTNGYGGAKGYPDMAPNDKKGLSYTTAALAAPVEVTGHPVVHLWVTSTAKDGDFFVYLEEVTPDGYSHYVTEGALRASHRAVSDSGYNRLGLPYHRSFAADVKPLPHEPVELAFDLHPTSILFATGSRIRVTIVGADKDNTLTPKLSPAPKVSIYRNAGHASFITLPVIPAASTQ